MDANRPDRARARRLAAAHAAARRGRVNAARRRVAIGAVGLFVTLWGAIGVEMASGHDPALAGRSSRATVTTTTESSTAAGAGGRGGQEEGASTEEATPSESTSPLTTSQS